MNKSMVACVSICLCLLFSATCFAGNTFRHPFANPVLTITFPDSWPVKQDPDAQAGIIANSPDEEIEIDLWALDNKEVQQNPQKALDDAVREVAGLIIYWVDDFNTEETERFSLNGIDFYELSGTAKDKEDGSPVKVVAHFFTPDNKTIFVMMYWGAEDAEAKYASDLGAIAKSIRKP